MVSLRVCKRGRSTLGGPVNERDRDIFQIVISSALYPMILNLIRFLIDFNFLQLGFEHLFFIFRFSSDYIFFSIRESITRGAFLFHFIMGSNSSRYTDKCFLIHLFSTVLAFQPSPFLIDFTQAIFHLRNHLEIRLLEEARVRDSSCRRDLSYNRP